MDNDGCAVIIFFALLIGACFGMHKLTAWDYRQSMVRQGVAHYEVDNRTGETKFVYIENAPQKQK